MIREEHDGYTVFRETPEELADRIAARLEQRLRAAEVKKSLESSAARAGLVPHHWMRPRKRKK